MLEFIEFILSTIGLTFIITNSYIFKNFRKYVLKYSDFFGKLIKCPACMGFWSGIIIKILLIIFYNSDLHLIIILIYGFIGSFASYVVYLLIKPLMDKYD